LSSLRLASALLFPLRCGFAFGARGRWQKLDFTVLRSAPIPQTYVTPHELVFFTSLVSSNRREVSVLIFFLGVFARWVRFPPFPVFTLSEFCLPVKGVSANQFRGSPPESFVAVLATSLQSRPPPPCFFGFHFHFLAFACPIFFRGLSRGAICLEPGPSGEGFVICFVSRSF